MVFNSKMEPQDIVVVSVRPAPEPVPDPAPAPELECAICNEIVDRLISVCPGEKYEDHRVCKTCINKMSKENEAIGCVYCGWRPEFRRDVVVVTTAPRPSSPVRRRPTVSGWRPCVSLSDALAYLLVGSFLAVLYMVIMACLLFVYKCVWSGVISDRSWCRHSGDVLTIENAGLGFVATLVIAGFVTLISLLVSWSRPKVEQFVKRCYGSQNEER